MSWALICHASIDSSGNRPIATTEFLQVVFDRPGCPRDVELTVSSIDNKWRVPYDRIAQIPRLNVNRAVIEVHPAKVVFIYPHHYKLLNVALVVAGQRRFEVNRRNLVFLEPHGDYLVSLLASDHCAERLTLSSTYKDIQKPDKSVA